MTENDLLKYAIKNGMIDISYVEAHMAMDKRKELLAKHPYKIWEGNDNRWYTYLPDKVKGRILKKRSTQKDIENVVIEYLKSQLDNPTINDIFNEWNDRRLELKKYLMLHI